MTWRRPKDLYPTHRHTLGPADHPDPDPPDAEHRIPPAPPLITLHAGPFDALGELVAWFAAPGRGPFAVLRRLRQHAVKVSELDVAGGRSRCCG